MKKIIILFVLVYNLLASNQIKNNVIPVESNFTHIEKEYIYSKSVTLGMIVDYYPFSFKDNGTITGFSYDYINLIMKKSGLNIKIEMDNWSNTLNKFKNKQIDMIDVISYKKSREKFTNFSQPYFEIPNVIFARKGEIENYTGFESLKGKKVGITKGIYYYNVIKDLGFDLVVFENSRDKMKALAFGKIDAIFNNLISGQKYIKQGGYSNITILEELDDAIVKREDLRIGVKKEDKVLYSIINKATKSITIAEKNQIYNKWFAAKIESKNTKGNFNLTVDEKQYLLDKKQITMCVDPDWMPFEKIDNGKHTGLASDYIKIVKNNINIPIKLIKTKNWEESIEKGKSRECDIFSMVPNVQKYKSYMNFTSPYVDIPMVIATKTDKQFIDSIQQILDKKIGIVKNYVISNILKEKYPNIKIVYVDSINDGLRKVESGDIFAFIDNLATVNYEIQKSFINTIKVSGRLDIRPKYGMAIRDDEPILYNIFEKIINNIDTNTKEKIFHKWVNPPKEEKVIDYTIAWYMLVAVSILIALFIFRQYNLKKSNRNLQIAVANKTKALKELNESLEQRIKEEVEKNNTIQEKLFKSEKMASMGEMIGNIAHQWRQPLSIISTASTGIIMEKEYGVLNETKLIETCNTINNNAQYLSKTIDDFKNFIKGDRVKNIFNLSDDIDSFLNLVEGSIKNHSIHIVQDIQKDIKIDGYENELTQCLINIFNNAKDALKENINTPDVRYLFITAYLEDDKIVIKLKDNGGGIPEDILPKIFEPYFTTKHQSLGTGLGLHMTYNLIVDGMGGTIEASNVNYRYNGKNYEGAEFTVKLPTS